MELLNPNSFKIHRKTVSNSDKMMRVVSFPFMELSLVHG